MGAQRMASIGNA